MKTLILFCLLLLIRYNSFSQTSQAYHSYDDYPTKILNVNGFKFVALMIGTRDFIDSTFILGYSANGKQKFRHRVNLIEVPHVNSMAITQDSCLLAVGYYFGNCDVLNSVGSFALKLDTNGVEQFFQYSNPTSSPSDNLNMIAASHPDWKNIVYSKNHIDTYDEQGNLTFSDMGIAMAIVHSAISTTFDSLIYMSNSEITANNDTVHYISTYELPNSLLNIISVNFTLKKILYNSEHFLFGLTNKGKIIKFNTNLDSIASTNISSNSLILNDFDIKQDTIYACASNSLSVVKFDKDLNPVYQNNDAYSSIHYLGISISQNSITLIGMETTTTNTLHPNYLIANTSLNGKIPLINDTYIEDFSVSSYSVNIVTPPAPYYPIAYFYFKLLAKVFNNSSDTLRSVYLNSPSYSNSGNSFCGITYNHQLIQNLHIPPFSFQYIETQTITDYKPLATGPQPNDSLLNNNYCIWSSAPNFQGDSNHANDAYCGRVVIPLVTGVNEINANNTVSIFPNPNKGQIHANFISKPDQKKYNLQITNTLGELVFYLELNNQDNTIDINNLSNGVYLLSIYDNEKQILFKKIVKQ